MDDEEIQLFQQIIEEFEQQIKNNLNSIKRLIERAKSLHLQEVVILRKAIIRIQKLQIYLFQGEPNQSNVVKVDKQVPFNQDDFNYINRFLNQCSYISKELRETYYDQQQKINNAVLDELEVDEKTLSFISLSNNSQYYGYSYKKQFQGRIIIISNSNKKASIFDGYYLDDSQIYGTNILQDENGKITQSNIQQQDQELLEQKEKIELIANILCYTKLLIFVQSSLLRIGDHDLEQQFYENQDKLKQLKFSGKIYHLLEEKRLNQYCGQVVQGNQKHGLGVYFDIEKKVIFAGEWNLNKPINGLLIFKNKDQVYETKLGDIGQYLNYIF